MRRPALAVPTDTVPAWSATEPAPSATAPTASTRLP